MSEEVLKNYTYAIAKEQAELYDSHIRLYIKKKPSWMPEFIYWFILKNVLEVAHFKK